MAFVPRFNPRQDRYSRLLAACSLASLFLSLVLVLGASVYVRNMELFPSSLPVIAASPMPPVSPLLLHYQLQLPGQGEVFPALVSEGHADYWPLAVLTITNNASSPAVEIITASIPGWSNVDQRTVVINAGQSYRVSLSPQLLPRAFQNQELRQAILSVLVHSPDDVVGFHDTRNVYLHGASDLYWGKRFANAQFVARWVTPHDPSVLNLIASARRYIRNGRLPGYEENVNPRVQAREVESEVRAVFEAMRHSGLSYVNSMFTFGNFAGDAERIRLPRETLTEYSANCIDVSVAFASAMENLGIDPVIMIVPGHAFTGVRLGENSNEIRYVDLTVLPEGTLASAEERARYWLQKTPVNERLMVDIGSARELGIYPME